MNIAFLRKIRIVISLMFFFVALFLFIDVYNYIPQNIFKPLLFLQFVPSLLTFLKYAGLASAGFIFIILLTAFFGRVYCSSICPMGTLIDIFNRLKKRKRIKERFDFAKPHNIIRYSILAITIFVFFIGSNFTLIFLDPYSNFGKISNSIIKPIVVAINNNLNYVLEKIDLFWLQTIDYAGTSVYAVLISAIIVLVVFLLSFTNGRLFCNSICPVGSLLSLISKFSIFKIVVDESNCVSCGSCEKYCKAQCIDSKNKFIDFSRCVSCFDCFDSCPTSGLKYELSFPKFKMKQNPERRNFVKTISLISIGLMGFQKVSKKIEVYTKSKISDAKKNYSTPPGSKNLENFLDNCTACHLCVSACPTQVIQPSLNEFGIFNLLTPVMNYQKGYCNYDCNKCIEVCPTSAIEPLKLEKKKLTQIGKAKFLKDNCVVYTQKTDCGACAEHCPTKAVHMVLQENLRVPKVEEEICIGCGACEHACPTIPYKAIYIEGNVIHKLAKAPKIKKVDEKIDLKEDFPF